MAVPEGIDADRGPPMAIPLRHFLVGLGFLVLAGLAGLAAVVAPAGLAHVHLALVGWVCVTIMGAMTQFVPVWSGVDLHSERLAAVQLPLASLGVLGLAAGFLAGDPGWLVAGGGLAVAGVWTFAYNLARTLARAGPLDVTERHFGLALAFFVAATGLGLVLALDLAVGVLGGSIARGNVVLAHATLAVFGAVLTAVLGALYQLATMFTQTDLDRLDRRLGRIEEAAFPAGVALLAIGRLFGIAWLATAGGLLVAIGAAAFAAVLGRRLLATSVERTPMLSRYAVAAVALLAWAALAAGAWIERPLSRAALLGAPGAVHLLGIGAIGFVVTGTLYHVVPFIVWVDRYSDLLGHRQVPMIDDLYDGRLAAVDFWATLVGGIGVLLGSSLGGGRGVALASGALAVGGFAVFAYNLAAVVAEHGGRSLPAVLLGRRAARREGEVEAERRT